MRRVLVLPLAASWLALAVLWLGCDPSANECEIGADCPSGACAANGVCVPLDADDDGSGGGGGSSATNAGGGGAGGMGAGGSGQGGSGLCPANGDLIIEASELVLGAGLYANLRVAQAVTFDTAGTAQGDGSRIWDFSAALTGDHSAIVETLALDGLWYASVFPTATYAARLTDASDLMGVYRVTASELLLLGVVSPEDGSLRTELTFEPPVTILDLPLSVGKTWGTSTTVTGLAAGVVAYYFEDYAFEVDHHGQALTPLGDFEVLRVHSELVRTVAGFPTTIQSHAFMAECFASVASVTSEDDELEVEFTEASEVRRLAP